MNKIISMWALAFLCAAVPRAFAAEPLRLKIVGGLGGVSQYTQLEEPFWRQRLREMSEGRIEATIAPYDQSGLRGQDMLQLMRLGVVPFGTALLSVVSGDEPELNAVDLPGLSPDIEALRRTVALYRPHIEATLRDRYGIELLGIYTYPAQVAFCAKSFSSLADLAGRRIRTSSVGQSEMMTALGAFPVVTSFAETVNAVRDGVVDCAITGTLSGVEIGLSKVTTHIHGMAISWGVSIFGANRAAWGSLPQTSRALIAKGVRELEHDIWSAAALETDRGFACAVGESSCPADRRGSMVLVSLTASDEVRRRGMLAETVLPRWIDRCGAECAAAWNGLLAPTLGVSASAE